jgi:hypothetical protein
MKKTSAVTIVSENSLKAIRLYVFDPTSRGFAEWLELLDSVYRHLNPDFPKGFTAKYFAAGKDIVMKAVPSRTEANMDIVKVMEAHNGPNLHVIVQTCQFAPPDRLAEKTDAWLASFLDDAGARLETLGMDVVFTALPIGLASRAPTGSAQKPSLRNCDFCGKSLGANDQAAVLTETALEEMEAQGILRRSGPPSWRDPAGQLRWVACLHCMGTASHPTKGLSDNAKKRCDFCGTSVLVQDATIAPSAEVQQAVRNGFNVYKSPGIKRPLFSRIVTRFIAWRVGPENLWEEWRQRVLADTTDWLLCPNCTRAFRAR